MRRRGLHGRICTATKSGHAAAERIDCDEAGTAAVDFLSSPGGCRRAADQKRRSKRPRFGTSDLVELVDWCRYVVGREPTSVLGNDAQRFAGFARRRLSDDEFGFFFARAACGQRRGGARSAQAITCHKAGKKRFRFDRRRHCRWRAKTGLRSLIYRRRCCGSTRRGGIKNRWKANGPWGSNCYPIFTDQ